MAIKKAYDNGICNAVKDCPNKAIYSLIIEYKDNEFKPELIYDSACEEHKNKYNNRIGGKLIDYYNCNDCGKENCLAVNCREHYLTLLNK